MQAKNICKTSTLLTLFLFVTAQIIAQTYSSKLVDTKTKKGIPYATIQYGENKGVITNEEGLFSFNINETTKLLDSVYISSMGYEKIGFSLEQFNDSIIEVKPKAIELSGVYLFDKDLEVDEIIERMKENLDKNHGRVHLKKRFFLRQSEYNSMQKVDVEFVKSTIEEINKKFLDSAISTFPSRYSYFTETLGDYYLSGSEEEKEKLHIVKAAELYDKSQEISFESFGERMEEILQKRLKKDSYLKIKSGWFGTKVQVDSIFEATEDSVNLEEKAPEKTYLLDNRKFTLAHLHKRAFEKKYALDVIKKTGRYEFELIGYTDIQDEGVYVLSFKTKGRSDFEGKLFINVNDFALMQIDYNNIKSVKKFKLLGFSLNQHTYNGSMVFSKTPLGNYTLKFARHTNGTTLGIDRPLKIVEKNKFVKGRRKQNELKVNLDIINSQTMTYEMVAFDFSASDSKALNAVKEDSTLKATYLKSYNPEFWRGYNIMEPNQAIREFTVDERN